MSEELMALGAFGVLLVGVWLYSLRLIQAELAAGRDKTDSTSRILEKISETTIPDLNFDALEERFSEILSDLVTETMEGMQMPTAMDHLMGAAANIIQHKMTSVIPPSLAELIPSLNEGEVESFDHGQAQNQ
jgi:hypothetical protein